MKRTTRKGDVEEGADGRKECRGRGRRKKGMSRKRDVEEGGVEKGGKMTRTSKEGTG